jgi:hypothetical protein
VYWYTSGSTYNTGTFQQRKQDACRATCLPLHADVKQNRPPKQHDDAGTTYSCNQLLLEMLAADLPGSTTAVHLQVVRTRA